MAAGPPAPVKYIKENHQHQIKIGIQKRKFKSNRRIKMRISSKSIVMRYNDTVEQYHESKH
jgi:hypothetical protein